MGCWNQTCAITNLPISAGEDVVGLFLVQQRYHHNNCHANCYWAPIPYLVYGKYDDYGSIEDYSSPTIGSIVQYFSDNIISDELKTDDHYKVPIRSEDVVDLDYVLNIERDQRLYVRNQLINHPTFSNDLSIVKQRRVQLIVIKKGVFNKIMSDYSFETWDNTDGKVRKVMMSYRDVQQRTSRDVFKYRQLTHEIRHIMDDISIAVKKEPQDNLYLMRQQRKLSSLMLDSRSIIEPSSHSSVFSTNANTMFCPDVRILHDIEQAIIKDDEKMINGLAEHISKAYVLCLFVDDGRMVWCPPSGAGSQSDDTTTQIMRGKLTSFAIKEDEKRRREKHGD